MNIFVIPSWYPTPINPIAGIFVKEQSMAIASFRKDINISIAKWDSGLTYLPLKNPILSCKAISFYLLNIIRNKYYVSALLNNYHEVYVPSLTWSNKLPFGGVERLIKSIETAFLIAVNTTGKVDLIHAHVSYPAGYIALKLSKKFNIPYVLTEHMGPFPFEAYLKGGKPMPEIRDAFQNAKRTIAVSHSLCKRITSFGLPCSDVVPNVVNEEIFSIGRKKNHIFTFLTICGMTDQKGIDVLLKAIKKLKILGKIQFVIAGDGHLLQKYKNDAFNLGIDNKITWLGGVDRDRVPNLFKQSHAYVMASKHETFGVVYAEAIACGLPIIATKCGGPEDIVNESNGLLVPINDVGLLVQAIEHVYYHYSGYNSNIIREDFLNRFSRQAVVEKITKIYDEAINE